MAKEKDVSSTEISRAVKLLTMQKTDLLEQILKKTAACEARQTEIVQSLRGFVPDQLKEYEMQWKLLENIMSHLSVRHNIMLNGSSMFSGLTEVEEKMGLLAKAWEGCIAINVEGSVDDPHMGIIVSVTLSVIL